MKNYMVRGFGIEKMVQSDCAMNAASSVAREFGHYNITRLGRGAMRNCAHITVHRRDSIERDRTYFYKVI